MLDTSALTEGAGPGQRPGCPAIYPATLSMSWLSTVCLPRPHDSERLAVAWTRWREKSPMPGQGGEALLDTLFGNSPYLTESALQDPAFMSELWRAGPDAALAAVEGGMATLRQ